MHRPNIAGESDLQSLITKRESFKHQEDQLHAELAMLLAAKHDWEARI